MPVYKDEERGTWFVSIRYKNWAGKADRKVKRGFARERDAKKWERDFLSQQAATCDMTLGALWELYMEDLSGRIREGTIDTKTSVYDTHIAPYWAEMPVNEITSAGIRRWQGTLLKKRDPKTKKTYSKTYLRSIHSQMSAILNYAVSFYNLNSNPCKAAGAMGEKKRDKEAMRFWTVDQFNKVIAEVTDPAKHLAFMTLFWLGIREGECLALYPSDLKWDNHFTITKTYHRRHGEDSIGPPKTKNSVRKLSAPDFLVEEYRNYTQRLYGLGKNDRVFYFTKSALGKELDRASAAVGIRKIRIHDLRHSHAALLIELGYEIPMLAERLGDTIQVVSDTYAHLYPNKQAKVGEELSKHKDGINK